MIDTVEMDQKSCILYASVELLYRWPLLWIPRRDGR